MTEGQIIFHLGMRKTGSTLLQKKVFPFLQKTQYHKKKYFEEYKKLIEIKNEQHLFSTELDQKLIEYIDEIIHNHPNAKIIIVFREPSDWICSKYKYSIRKHGDRSFNQFIDLKNNDGLWKTEDLLFSKIIEKVLAKCNTKPLLLDYSELRQNPNDFVNKILSYLNDKMLNNIGSEDLPKVNKAFSEKQLRYLLRFNQFYSYEHLKTKYRFVNRIHYKYREFLLHLIAFIFKMIPTQHTQYNPLISDDQKEKIKLFFAEDWEICKSKLS